MENREHKITIGWLSFLFWTCLVFAFLGACLVGGLWLLGGSLIIIAWYPSYAVLFLCAVAALLVGIEGSLVRSKEYFRRKGLFRGGAVVCIAAFMVIYLIYARPHLDFAICGFNLRNLAGAMLDYEETHGRYPPVERWCDEIIEFAGNDPYNYAGEFSRHLTCPSVGGQACTYAMNPNAKPASKPQTVLLFESRPGWNQSGCPEIAVFENHFEQCSVILTSYQVISVNKEEFDTLNW